MWSGHLHGGVCCEWSASWHQRACYSYSHQEGDRPGRGKLGFTGMCFKCIYSKDNVLKLGTVKVQPAWGGRCCVGSDLRKSQWLVFLCLTDLFLIIEVLFRSAFWFIWWNMQEIFHGFDKSRAMWVFQHKYSFLVTIVETQWRESTLLKNWWPSWNSCHNLSRQTNQDSLMQRLSRGKNSKLLVLNERKKFHRKYHLLSRERVQPFIDAEEKVNQLPGVSKIHQAFSTGER